MSRHDNERDFHGVAWQGYPWLGFSDYSNWFLTSDHPVGTLPYRIVRAKPGCTCQTEFALQYPE